MADSDIFKSALDGWRKMNEDFRKSVAGINTATEGLRADWASAANLPSFGEKIKKDLDLQKSLNELAIAAVFPKINLPTGLGLYPSGRAPETKKQPAPDLQAQQAAKIEKLEAELKQAVAERNQAVAERKQAYDVIAEIMISEDGS